MTRNPPADLDVQAMHPKNGAKYSPNLYKWLTSRKRPYRAWNSRVYRDPDGTLYIGLMDDGDLIGAMLYTVLCAGAKAESWCYPPTRGMVEVDDFWTRYLADGRCAIDPEHARYFVEDPPRWRQEGDTRTCLWCGKAQQVLARWTEVVERQEWRDLQHNAMSTAPQDEHTTALFGEPTP